MLDHLYRRVYEGVNYRLRGVAGGRLASHCRPVSIGFMLTNICNARCLHCDIWKNKGRDDGPTMEGWKQVLTDLREWLGPVAIFFSGGEALLKPYAPDLVAHASQIGLSVEFLTHGYWDELKRVERLAMANPSRITLSLDGVGEAHSLVRGRPNFFEKTTRTIELLQSMRKEHSLQYDLRIKTVIMDQNMDTVCEVPKYTRQEGMHSFFQSIEQNYNTPEDPDWFLTSPNWPKDPEKAVRVVQQLMQMKRDGYHIDNSFAQLEAMIPYFRNPASLRVAIQSHSAHEKKAHCTALVNLQFNPNGDVVTCWGMPPVGNIKEKGIREVWENRPNWWQGGCCMERRCSAEEKELLQISSVN